MSNQPSQPEKHLYATRYYAWIEDQPAAFVIFPFQTSARRRIDIEICPPHKLCPIYFPMTVPMLNLSTKQFMHSTQGEELEYKPSSGKLPRQRPESPLGPAGNASMMMLNSLSGHWLGVHKHRQPPRCCSPSLFRTFGPALELHSLKTILQKQ